MTRVCATLLILTAMFAGCGADDPGTSIDVALQYSDSLQLETADVTLRDRTQSKPIAHRLLLLVPDELAGVSMPMEIWGRKAGKRAAYGAGSATPALGVTINASLMLSACSPGCQGQMLTTCVGPTVACILGCSEDGDAHCIGPKPSNGIDATAADPLNGTTTISANTTFDVDTGAITGGLTRAAGTGVDSGIGYVQADAFAAGGAKLGIFVFHNLTVDAAATVELTGTRAVVWLVGDAAKIAGIVDVTAGHGTRSTPGPGGGAGGSLGVLAQGCGAGGPGTFGTGGAEGDSGGAGGGAGTAGGMGGTGKAQPGGTAGPGCMPMSLEPLQGGSGGGIGSLGSSATVRANGGGGGGALQITALGSLDVTGTINAGGAGGDGGPLTVNDAGAGAGGGSGGAILLEAPTVTVGAAAILAANGGGGGGGGRFGSGAGGAGGHANASLIPAPGGTSLEPGLQGGSGGALNAPPAVGGTSTFNGAGGGGAVGVIVIRGRVVTITGKTTPRALQTDIQPREMP